jgi:predicted transposase/invertase (TIGR01784 family)
MSEIINPHDKLFKEIEKVKENSRDLIESTFPLELLEKLDLDTLENDNNSYIDESLQEYYSDIVYNCEYVGNTRIKISILFEHKSYKPRNEYLQLLRYILNIWDYAEKNKEEPLIVVPVIFYHGKEKWVVKPLFKYFKGVDEILRKFIPDFKYILTDLNEISDTEIINEKFKSNINKVMALLFKHMKDENYLKEQMTDIFFLIKDFFGTEKRSVVITFLFYIMSATEIDKDYIEKCLNSISPEGGEITMTTAMKLREEGLQEGKQEDAKIMLQKGYPIDDIVEITGLSKEEIQKLR